jgi:hypothetical protein
MYMYRNIVVSGEKLQNYEQFSEWSYRGKEERCGDTPAMSKLYPLGTQSGTELFRSV